MDYKGNGCDDVFRRKGGKMSNFKSYRDQSKRDYGTNQDHKLSLDQIQLGAILRIADASEKMASNYSQMQQDLDWYRIRCKSLNETIESRNRQIANLRGQITKLKKKMQ